MYELEIIVVCKRLVSGEYALYLLHCARKLHNVAKLVASAYTEVGAVSADALRWEPQTGAKRIQHLTADNQGGDVTESMITSINAQLDQCILTALAEIYPAVFHFSPNGKHPGK